LCRPAFNECDVAETCDGISTECPADNFSPIFTPCGSDNETDCDKKDFCDGTGFCLNNWVPNGESCGTEEDECTYGDQCSNGVCVQGSHKPKYTKCGNETESDCDNPDFCNGKGMCLTNWKHDGLPCGIGGDECRDQDTCFQGKCQPNGIKPDLTPCGKAEDECNQADVCRAGVCTSTPKPEFTPCGQQASEGLCDLPDSCDVSSTICHGVFSAEIQ